MNEAVRGIDLRHLLLAAAIVGTAVVTLLLFGRAPWCECGYVKLWHGEVLSSENSQHIADWYSPSHIVHGILFYGVLSLLAGSLSMGLRANIAVAVEALWEVIENTDAIIDRYREATIALDYYGDSVLNSASDILFMGLGFALAARLPVWASIAVVLVLELAVAYAIRDNLTLNVIMLIYPLDAIKAWQMG